MATSAKNNCLYCIVAHGALQRLYSKSPLLADQVYVVINHIPLSSPTKSDMTIVVCWNKTKLTHIMT